MITSVWHKILHKRNVLYEILFIALATILHFFKMYANEEIQEDIVSVTEQGIIHLLLILAVIYIGMFLKYHNKRNVMNMAGRVLDKVLCLLIIMKILRNEIDKGTVIMLAKICEAQCISDDNIMEKVTEELNILRTLLEKDEHVKGKTTMEWDIPKIKEYIDYVANMEKKSVVKELVDKLNEIVSIAVELDESREYTALRSELLKCCR